MARASSSQRLSDAARDLNVATRFGRLDVAAEHAEQSTRAQFLERRALWGTAIRIADVEVTGIKVKDREHAEVLVQLAWLHIRENLLHSTVLRQHWENPEQKGWVLTREEHASGGEGLFGSTEGDRPQPSKARPDVHFPSKTLGKSPERR